MWPFPKIRKAFGLHKNTDISDILQDVVECRHLGRSYNGNRVVDANKRLGRPQVIELDSIEAQIICDYLEEGGSVRNAHSLVNEHRRQQNLASLTIAATHAALHRASPKRIKVETSKQGSNDLPVHGLWHPWDGSVSY